MKKYIICILLIIFVCQFSFSKSVILEASKDLDKQVLFSNTTYIVKENIKAIKDLPLPDNCVLQFEGGIIEGNCKLTGNNTYIFAAPVRIFSDGISIKGTWINNTVYPEWFGAKGDGTTDDRFALQKALDTPITKVVLSKRDYLVASYTIPNKKVGLVIPSQKKIEGDAMNGWNKYYSISASQKIPFDVFLLLSGYQISMKGIAVYGSTSDEYDKYMVKDLIATKQDKFYTNLNFENVYVRSCINNCFNLYTYNSNLCNCYADRANVGFYIHGGNGRGTTISLHMCYAERLREKAFYISKISYSSLQLCAADHCGLGTINKSHIANDSFGYNYYYEDCRAISEISCGHEAGGYSHYLIESRGMIIQTGRYTSDGLTRYKSWNSDLSKNMWVLRHSFGVKIEGCTMATGMNDNSILFQQDKYTTNTTIENCDFTNLKGYFNKMAENNIYNVESLKINCIK